MIDNEPAWLSGPVNELSPQTGNNRRSFGPTEAGLGAHRQTFAAPTTHPLGYGNAANDVAAELWAMPRTAGFTHNNGIQLAEKPPRVGETGINGSRAEQPERRIDIKTVPADIPTLGFQNINPTSQNQGENRDGPGKAERAFGNHQFGTRHPPSDYAQIARAVVGSLPSTSQQLRPSPASLQHRVEEDYRGVIPYGRTGHPLQQHYGAGDLHGEEPPPRYERPENNTQRRFECGVCMDVQPEDHITFLDPCRHTFCRNCIKNHIGSQLSEHRFPILCPVCEAEPGTTNPGSVYLTFLKSRIANLLILCFSRHRCLCSAILVEFFQSNEISLSICQSRVFGIKIYIFS